MQWPNMNRWHGDGKTIPISMTYTFFNHYHEHSVHYCCSNNEALLAIEFCRCFPCFYYCCCCCVCSFNDFVLIVFFAFFSILLAVHVTICTITRIIYYQFVIPYSTIIGDEYSVLVLMLATA